MLVKHFTDDRYRWTLENMLTGVEDFIDIYRERAKAEREHLALPPDVTRDQRVTVQHMIRVFQSAVNIHNRFRTGDDGGEAPLPDHVLRLNHHLAFLRNIGVDGFALAEYPDDVLRLMEPIETKGMGQPDRHVGRPVMREGEIYINVGDLCDICNEAIEEGDEVTMQRIDPPGRPLTAQAVGHARCVTIPEGSKIVHQGEFGGNEAEVVPIGHLASVPEDPSE